MFQDGALQLPKDILELSESLIGRESARDTARQVFGHPVVVFFVVTSHFKLVAPVLPLVPAAHLAMVLEILHHVEIIIDADAGALEDRCIFLPIFGGNVMIFCQVDPGDDFVILHIGGPVGELGFVGFGAGGDLLFGSGPGTRIDANVFSLFSGPLQILIDRFLLARGPWQLSSQAARVQCPDRSRSDVVF